VSKAKILIVEDETIVAEDIKNILVEGGFNVVSIAQSSEEAIKQAGEVKPDMVLMDIMLGGGTNGIEAAEELKRRFNLPIVYVTAYTDDETLKRAKLTRPYGYIKKPFEAVELCTIIELALFKSKKEIEEQITFGRVGRGRKKEKKAKNKKLFSKKQMEIINVALDIILKEGIQKLTLKNITERMGLTESSIYRHFKSKVDILVAIVKSVEDSFNSIFEKVTESTDNAMGKLRFIVFEWIDKYYKNQSFIPLSLSEEILKGEVSLNTNANNISKKSQRIISDLVIEAQRDEMIRRDVDPLYVALIITGSISTMINEWNKAEFKFDLKIEGEKLWATLMKLLKVD